MILCIDQKCGQLVWMKSLLRGRREDKKGWGGRRERDPLSGNSLPTFCLASPSSFNLNVTSLGKFSLLPNLRQS